MNPRTRRTVLAQGGLLAMLAASGLLTAQQVRAAEATGFDAKTLDDALKALGAKAVDSKDVVITSPDIAENGAVVPVGAATTLPGVKRMLLLVEKNPSVLTAAFDVSDAIDASFTTRVKMGQSSDIYAIAVMNDGKLLYAKKEVKVTLGGCGG